MSGRDDIEPRRASRPARGFYGAGLLIGLLASVGVMVWLVVVAVRNPNNDALWLIWPALIAAIGCVRRLGWLAGIHEED